MSEIAVVFGYVCLVGYIFYLSHDLMGKPKNNIEKGILKFLQPQHIAIFIRIIGMWVVVGGMGLLAIMSAGTAYETFMENALIATLYMTGGFSIVYLVLYVIFLITEHMTNMINWRFK